MVLQAVPPVDISIHALRKESDSTTRSVNGTSTISIHALRKESDLASIDDGTVRSDFNPRSP